jgi:hypothetical protein
MSKLKGKNIKGGERRTIKMATVFSFAVRRRTTAT